MKRLTLLFSFLLTVQLSFAQQIKESKSRVTFEISNMAFKTVEGSFTGMKGMVNFDQTNLSTAKFEVCIDAASVNTGNQKRDDHLRNEDFFEVKTYPEICFSSTSVTKSGSKYVAKGTLTMHGVSKAVEIPFTFSNKTFSGTLEISRYDFKVGEDTGTFMVGEDVELKIICVVE